MSRGRIVALVGIDGSGKSTQAARLTSTLREQGTKARTFENAGGRPVLDGLAHLVGRADGAALIGARARTASEVLVRSLAIGRSVAWARLTGGTAVMDRYAICQLATMQARGDRGIGLVRRLSLLAPAPDLLIWCAVDPPLARARVLARGRDEETIEWLAAFDSAYATLLPPTAVRLDVSSSTGAVHAELLALVNGTGSHGAASS